jgi:hypothetical protein
VLAGAYPASQCDAETEKLLTTLLQPPCGVTTFVCLQAEVNIHVPGALLLLVVAVGALERSRHATQRSLTLGAPPVH